MHPEKWKALCRLQKILPRKICHLSKICCTNFGDLEPALPARGLSENNFFRLNFKISSAARNRIRPLVASLLEVIFVFAKNEAALLYSCSGRASRKQSASWQSRIRRNKKSERQKIKIAHPNPQAQILHPIFKTRVFTIPIGCAQKRRPPAET